MEIRGFNSYNDALSEIKLITNEVVIESSNKSTLKLNTNINMYGECVYPEIRIGNEKESDIVICINDVIYIYLGPYKYFPDYPVFVHHISINEEYKRLYPYLKQPEDF